MKKRFLPLALALVPFALAGCGGEKYDPNALTVMGKTSDLNKPYMTEIFDHFKKTTGENLNIVKIEDAKFEEEALKRLGSDRAPDILLHFHNADLNNFNVEENFLDLKGETWVDDLTESAEAYCTDANGRLLGLPFWESSVSGCYYNKTLLDELGLAKKVNTQTDFDGLCRALLDDDRCKIPLLWPAKGCSWMVQFGLDPVFADDPEGPELLARLNKNEISYADIPAVGKMVAWIANAAQSGWFGDKYLETGWDDISPALASGEAAMTFIWDTWFYTDFTPGKYSKEDFALMPVFMDTAEGGTYEGGNLNMMMVNAKSEKKERALEFLNFCATPENYNVAFNGISTVSVFKGQTTNIQSKMVTDAAASIAALERVSTASTKIVGYSAEEAVGALNEMFRGKRTVKEVVAKMDADRKAAAKKLGTAGF